MPKRVGGNSEQPPDLAALLKGLYEKVARQLGLDPYYVSRVARGEFPSRMIEDALTRELLRTKSRLAKGRGTRQGVTHKKRASKKTKKARALKKKGLRLVAAKTPWDPNQ